MCVWLEVDFCVVQSRPTFSRLHQVTCQGLVAGVQAAPGSHLKPSEVALRLTSVTQGIC